MIITRTVNVSKIDDNFFKETHTWLLLGFIPVVVMEYIFEKD